MKSPLLGLVAACLLSLPMAARAAEAPFVIDTSHTQTTFTIDRFGFTTIIGAFGKSSGTIFLDEAAPDKSRVEAVVEIGTLWAGDATREDHIKGPRWLNAAANPTASFKSTKVTVTGKDTATVEGDLTLMGKTLPQTFEVKLNKLAVTPNNNKKTAGFTITGVISRKAFGSVGAANLIGDAVSVRIEALAVGS
jgi:polyisoprenoid-binding protein YceI